MRKRITDSEDPRRCERCKYFRQHFVPWETDVRGFRECDCGHCVRSRLRATKPRSICDGFEEKPPM